MPGEQKIEYQRFKYFATSGNYVLPSLQMDLFECMAFSIQRQVFLNFSTNIKQKFSSLQKPKFSEFLRVKGTLYMKDK